MCKNKIVSVILLELEVNFTSVLFNKTFINNVFRSTCIVPSFTDSTCSNLLDLCDCQHSATQCL